VNDTNSEGFIEGIFFANATPWTPADGLSEWSAPEAVFHSDCTEPTTLATWPCACYLQEPRGPRTVFESASWSPVKNTISSCTTFWTHATSGPTLRGSPSTLTPLNEDTASAPKLVIARPQSLPPLTAQRRRRRLEQTDFCWPIRRKFNRLPDTASRSGTDSPCA
jgi:hypothetical protein